MNLPDVPAQKKKGSNWNQVRAASLFIGMLSGKIKDKDKDKIQEMKEEIDTL